MSVSAGNLSGRSRVRGGFIALAASILLALLAVGAAPAFAALQGETAPGVAAVQGLRSAGVQDFVFQSMDVEYTLGRAEDGTSTLRVIESFVAVFPEFDQNRGMQRRIPDSYEGVPTFPTLESVTDAEGNPRPVEEEWEDDHLIVTSRADGFVHGAQTYVFTYTMQNVVGTFADTQADEFYWDVNGVDWAQPFGRVSARVNIPGELADARTGGMACYRGAQGSTETCEISESSGEAGSSGEESADGAGAGGEAGSSVVSASAGGLGAFETMTVAIGFEAGTFTPFDSSYLASPWGWLQGFAGLLAGGALAFGAVMRARHMRDEPGRPVIVTEFAPPAGVDALESAVLLGKTTKAIPAEVLEQAIVGSIHIVEGPPKLFGGTKLQAHLVDRSRADGDGAMLLDGLFPPGSPPGTVYEFGKSDTRFSTAAQAIIKSATSELVSRGLRRPVSGWARVLPILAAAGAATLVFVLGIIAIEGGVTPWIPIALMGASVVVVAIVIGLVSRQPVTVKGAETRDHLAGLRIFIEWAEEDRIRMLQSPEGAERVRMDVNDPRQRLRLYEVLLPYAVVFGQEKEWARHLAALYDVDGSPGWYTGSTGFNAAAFSAGIGSLSSSASSASSTSGGSGGGGSAGGGGGGGGGGGV
ncbi:MAG TPA: DUF2207 domain-containing protein [Microbacterium sp.]|uniref:DUF2207 family protein n=1 Tax=Microbacterium sp. TaxID=51671 RepID=UPI002CA72031|nr:DUF2207 domain-containing protein [Microbacterium sp.]HWI30622.1 DUF2207 domain-containing protein [Microbacterium sp.]